MSEEDSLTRTFQDIKDKGNPDGSPITVEIDELMAEVLTHNRAKNLVVFSIIGFVVVLLLIIIPALMWG